MTSDSPGLEYRMSDIGQKWRFQNDFKYQWKAHDNIVSAIHTFKSEKILITCSQDSCAKAWAIESEPPKCTLMFKHPRPILSSCIMRNEEWLCTCDNIISIWDITTGSIVLHHSNPNTTYKSIANVPYRSSVSSGIGIAEGGTQLYCGGNNLLACIDVRAHGMECSLAAEWNLKQASDSQVSYGTVTSIRHFDEYSVACGTSNGYIFVFDTRSNSQIYRWQGHDQKIFQILSPSSHSLISIGYDNLYLFYYIIFIFLIYLRLNHGL